MSKITHEHFDRQAIVYIRQSTADQVANNLESQRRQYGLADRARQLGWRDVAVIDDDLGRSGGGVSRPGFEKLLAAICEGRVGAVVSIEASRLARNGRDWHTLLEFCGLVGTLILDEDGVYDPRYPNDRLLLGMKGTMSEMELSVLRQRSLEALKQKARRGELFMTVAIGYVRIGNNRIEKDPDRRIAEEKQRQVELALEQARYEVRRARRQYDTVDPDNRLVAAELETRWNERLTVVRDLEPELDKLTMSCASEGMPVDRERLLTLGADLQRAWTSAGVTSEAKKRIVRTLIDEIVVRVEDNALDLVICWHGGDHSALKVKKNRSGQHRWSVEGETIDLVRVLARQMPDKAIASVFNRAGKTTGRGNGWTQSRVCSL